MDHLTHATDMPVGDKKSRVPHLNLTYRTWERIQKLLRAGEVEINGHDLDIASVVAVAKYVSIFLAGERIQGGSPG
jgi:hypothetical protein